MIKLYNDRANQKKIFQ